jgi:hypothetical protein
MTETLDRGQGPIRAGPWRGWWVGVGVLRGQANGVTAKSIKNQRKT